MIKGERAGISCGHSAAASQTNDGTVRAGFSFILLVLGLVLLLAAPLRAQDYRFNTVQVEGNQRIETSTIVTYLGFGQGESISAGQLNDAYQRVQGSGVFETVEFEPRGSTLLVRVKEFPTINAISFEGNERLDDEALGALIESAPRRVFNKRQAEADAALLAEAYSQQGRMAATITPRIIRRSDNRVDLVFEIAEGTTTEVERISFVGNRAYSDRRLRRVLETKQATFLRAFLRDDTLITDRVEFDKQVLRDFYLSRGYVDFRVLSANAEVTRERDGVFLVFNVQEGQQFRFGKITTVSEIPGADELEFQDALRIKPGVIYTPTLIESSIARQERLALKQGIDFLRVEPRITRNERDLTLDVEFALTRGPRIFVERIDIEGNTTTLDRVIRREFKIVEGDPFNPREIRQSAERIRALGYFANADVEAREGSSPNQVIVDVDVEEQPTGSLTLGGSYSVNDGFGVAIGLQENNFLGRGQRLSLNWSTASESEQYVIGFSEPYLLGRELRFDVDLGYTEADSSFASYDTERLFFSPALTFALGERSSLSLRYNYSQDEMLARTPPNNGVVIGNEIAAGELDTSSLGLVYRYDSRIGGLNPNSGYLFEIGSSLAGLGGDNEYLKTNAKLIGQTRILSEEVTLRATLEAGALTWRGDTSSRAIDRYLLGPDIFRGFEPGGIGPREINGTVDDALGGNFYAVARFEAEFPLGLPEEIGLRGGVFYDVGNLWDLSNANTAGASIVGEGGSFRHVIGLAFLWDTAIGPLRFNFTRALRKEDFDREQSFDLTLSTQF